MLFDCLKGDATNFTHWEELKSTWKFVDAIQEHWTMIDPNFLTNYNQGQMAPIESDLLLQRRKSLVGRYSINRYTRRFM